MSKYSEEYYEKLYLSNFKLRKKGDKPYIYNYFRRFYKKYLNPGSKLLDIGCGLGFGLIRLKDDFQCFGIDISGYAIDFCKKNVGNVTFIHTSVEKLSFENNYFDIVQAFDVIEHTNNPELFLKEANRILKKDGFLILSTPNPGSVGRKVKKLKSHVNRDKTHISIKDINTWRKLLEQNSFKIVRDGTDFLWDYPYLTWVPAKLQGFILISITWVIGFLFGFLGWSKGENYYSICRKINSLEIELK
jgi:SAM-dependent methyltransferase